MHCLSTAWCRHAQLAALVLLLPTLAPIVSCGDDDSPRTPSDTDSTTDETDESTDSASTDSASTDGEESDGDETTDVETDVGETDETDAAPTDGPGTDTDGPDASGPEIERWLDDPLNDFPERLSDTGIYPDLDDRSTIAVEAFEYVPRFPLWSDGLHKQRGIVVPEGESLVEVEGQYEFPDGTVIYKTFSTDTAPIETRFLRRAGGDWDYAVYLWNEEASEAELLDGRTDVLVDVQTEWGEVSHVVPGRLTCRQCHESSTSFVLGFQPQQLLDAAAGFDQLTALQDAAVIEEVPEVSDPVADYDGLTKDVLGYFVGNCAHCHNGENGIASSYDLRPGAALENIIDQPTQSSASATGTRVVPGNPDASILFAAFSGETEDPEVKLMPPVGVSLVDPEGVQLVRAWIEAL